MPEPIQEGPALITKTKTRTKIGVTTLVLVVGLGMMAAVGNMLPTGMVCDSGSRVGQSCHTNLDCRVRSADQQARCVTVTKLPDLVTKISDITCLYDTNYPDNSALTFQVEITNKGSTPITTPFATDISGINYSGSAYPPLTDGGLALSGDSFRPFMIASLPAGATVTHATRLQPTGRLFALGIVSVQAATDRYGLITESNELNNTSNIATFPPCRPATPNFSLHPASPSGPGVPGLIEVLRFNLIAPTGGFPASLPTLQFTLTTTDTNGTGTPGGDWNTWRSSSESFGLSPSSFTLYDSADLTTPIGRQFRLSSRSGESLVGLSNDTHTAEVPYLASIPLSPQINIPAGTAKTYVLKMNTTGAARGDSLRIDIPGANHLFSDPPRVTGNTITF